MGCISIFRLPILWGEGGGKEEDEDREQEEEGGGDGDGDVYVASECIGEGFKEGIYSQRHSLASDEADEIDGK